MWPGSAESDEAILAKCRRGLLVCSVVDGVVCGYGAAFSWHGRLPDLTDTDPSIPGALWWHVHDIAVSAAYRGRGVGEELLTYLLEEGRRRGITSMRAVAVSGGGLVLLERAGFKVNNDLLAPPGYEGAPVLELGV